MFNQPILSLLILLITSLGFTQNQAITILKNQRVKIDDNLFIEYTYSGHEHVSYSSEEPFSATVATYQLILTKKDGYSQRRKKLSRRMGNIPLSID